MLNSPQQEELEHQSTPSSEQAVTEQIEDDYFSLPTLANESIFKPSSDIRLMGLSTDSLHHELQVGYLSQDPTVGYMDLQKFGVCKERDDILEMKEEVAKLGKEDIFS